MTLDLPNPDYARNMRLDRPLRSGRPARRRAGNGASRLRLCRPHVLQGLQRDRRARSRRTRARSNYLAAPPNTWNIHLQTHDDLLLVINAKDMFAAAEFADEKAYYKGQLGKVVGTAEKKSSKRNWTAGIAVYDISEAARRRARSVSCRSTAAASIALVHRRPLGLRLGADRRLHRLHLHHRRHERSGKAARSGALVDSRHEHGRRRDAEMAGAPAGSACTTRSFPATPPTRPGAMPAWWCSMSPTAPSRN